MLQSFIAKPWLARPLYISANNVLTQSNIALFCLLLLSSTQLTPSLLPLTDESHYWGHTEIWQVSSVGMAEHCSAQATDILRKPSKRRWALSPGLTFLDSLPPLAPMADATSFSQTSTSSMFCGILHYSTSNIFQNSCSFIHLSSLIFFHISHVRLCLSFFFLSVFYDWLAVQGHYCTSPGKN